ncbi:MAG: hypothetical protein AAGB00_03225 [Planctomycetota bacterium]
MKGAEVAIAGYSPVNTALEADARLIAAQAEAAKKKIAKRREPETMRPLI